MSRLPRFPRRSFLRSSLTAAALPFLPSLVSDAQAQDHSYARVIFIVWDHGVQPTLWQPHATGFEDVGENIRRASMRDVSTGLYMGNYFSGLEDKISMLKGIGQLSAWGHQTSVALSAGERGEDISYRVTSTVPRSIDNVLAGSSAVYSRPPALDVLRLSMGGLNETHSYVDHQWVAALSSDAAFARLFGDGFPDSTTAPPAGPSDAERRVRRRLSVLQRAIARYDSLRASGRISAADLRRIEATLEQYRALEVSAMDRLAGYSGEPMASLDACTPFSVAGADGSDDKMREHIALFTQAFACGSSRIGYWKLNSSHADSDGAHQANSTANQREDGLYTRVMRDNCRRISELLRAMDAIEEGNGRTLLDNSLVVVTSSMATSVIGEHPGADAPFLLAGGLGGQIRMGEFIDYSDQSHMLTHQHDHAYFGGPPHNELLISIMRAFGLDESDWGGGGFGDYQCVRDATCTNRPYGTQSKLVDYYNSVHAPRRSPGAELPYLRVG